MREVARSLIALVRNDLRLLLRHGLAVAYAVVVLVYGVILRVLPQTFARAVLPIMVASDPVLIGCIFAGAMVLMEREWGIPGALSVSGVSVGLLVVARVIAFALVSTLVAGALLVVGLPVLTAANLPALIAAVCAGAVVTTGVGLVLAYSCGSMNSFLFALALPMLVLVAPIAGLWAEGPWRYAWALAPSYGAFFGIASAMGGSGIPAAPAHPVLVVVSALSWAVISIVFARRVMKRRLRELVLEVGSL